MRGEVTKPVSTVEEVSKEPQYIVDREKVRNTLNRAHQILVSAECLIVSGSSCVAVVTLFVSADVSNAATCVLQHGAPPQVLLCSGRSFLFSHALSCEHLFVLVKLYIR